MDDTSDKLLSTGGGFSFESLINSVEAIVWEADFKTSKIAFVSNYVIDLLGFKLEDWLANPDLFSSIVHPDDRPKVARAKAMVTRQNNHYEVVYRVRKANGDQVWLSDRVSVSFDGEEPHTLRGVSYDVSERRSIEEALALVVEVTLAASELETVQEIAQTALSRICEILGLGFGQVWFPDVSNENLVCSPLAGFSLLEQEQLRQESLDRTLNIGRSEGLPGMAAASRTAVFLSDLKSESRPSLHHSDSLRHGFALPVFNGDNILCVFEFFGPHKLVTDKYFLNALDEIAAHLSVVFERRRAQELLVIQRAHEEIILDSMPVMVWFKDTQGRILRVNRSGAAKRGMEPWQMVGKSDWELYPDEADLYYADDLEVMRSGRPKLGIIEQHLQGDGSKTWVSTDKIPYRSPDGTVQGVIVFASDISKLKFAEEELLTIRQELEDKVAERTKELDEANIYFALSRDLLCIATTDGYFRRLNFAWQEKLGYEISELIERPYLHYVHPDDKEKTIEQMQVLLTGGIVREFENRYIRKDGSICWLLWSASTPSESDYVYAVAYDITDRKAAESELLDISMALKNAVEGIAKVNEDSRFLSVNESYASLHGMPSHDFIGRKVTDFIASEDMGKWLTCFGGMLRDGKSEAELLGVTDGGVQFHEQITLVKKVGTNSDFEGYYIFDKDITKRKATEASLQKSEARFHHLATHVPGGIYQFIRHTNGLYSFPYVSPGFGRIVGVEPDRAMDDASNVFNNVHPEDLHPLMETIEESAREMTVFVFEGRILTDQGVRWFHAISTPEYTEDGDISFNGLLTDITDKKVADQKIRTLNENLSERVEKLAAVNQELESLTRKLELAYDAAMEASKFKSEFVANISHEIRTPISAVIGMSELLLDTSLTDEQRQFSSMVRDSAQSLLTIINDILDFSKMEAGHMELELAEVNLLDLLEDCAELLAPSARKKGLSFLTFVSPDVPEVVLGDTVRIRQILLNLASNAVKFTSRGEVIITVKSSPFEPDMMRFSVRDTGIGLSDSAKLRLFSPFVQADGSTTRTFGGTGLGLSISKLLVELMGGVISFSSVEGEGAVFWFDLPLPISAATRSVAEVARAYANKAKLQAEEKLASVSRRLLVASSSEQVLANLPPYLSATAPRLDIATLKLDSQESFSADAVIDALIIDVTGASDKQGDFDGDDSEPESNIAVKRDPASERLETAPSGKELLKITIEQLKAQLQKLPRFVDGQIRILILLPGEGHGLDELARHNLAGLVDSADSAAVASGMKLLFMVKPLRLSDLIEGYSRLILSKANFDPAISSGGMSRSVQSTSGDNLPVFSRLPLSSHSPLILVAEDNAVMRELALRQLTRLGLTCVVVKNGKQAVEAVRTKNFALVLMDCQMPEMDGYEATLTIRRDESERGGHVPIIAMTASAMKGDRENCLASGMDDYVAKPVGQTDLLRLVHKWVVMDEKVDILAEIGAAASFAGAHGESVNSDLAASPAQDKSALVASLSPPIDVLQLINLYGQEDLARLLKSFLNETAELIAEIGMAAEHKDGSEVARLAHQLKGLALVMTAVKLSENATSAEKLCNQTKELGEVLTKLEDDFYRVREYLATHPQFSTL